MQTDGAQLRYRKEFRVKDLRPADNEEVVEIQQSERVGDFGCIHLGCLEYRDLSFPRQGAQINVVGVSSGAGAWDGHHGQGGMTMQNERAQRHSAALNGSDQRASHSGCYLPGRRSS